jgi:putative transposase
MEKIYKKDPNASIQDIHDESINQINKFNKKVKDANQHHLRHSQNVTLHKKIKEHNYKTTWRYVNSIDDYEIAVLRFGEAKATKMYRVVGTKEQPTRPLERVEMDHSLLKFYIIDDETFLPLGFVWLTVAIDVCTRMVCGFHISFEDPNYSSVMECLLHCILPKDYVHKKYPKINNSWKVFGKPEKIFVDNGPDFRSGDLEQACNSLNIILEYQPPYQPWYKAVVEKFFGTLNKKLLKHHPGTAYIDFLKKHDKDFKPHKNAIVTLNRLIEIIHIYFIDVFQQSYHRGLNGVPAKEWENRVKDISVDLPFKDSDELLILLCKRKNGSVTEHGIELKGLYYNNKELVMLRTKLKGEPVDFKYDPRDISIIYVYDAVNKNYLPIPAVNQSYAKGLSMRQHDVIRSFRRKESDQVNRLSLIEAKNMIFQIIQEDKDKFKIKGRKTVAAFMNKRQPRENSEMEFSADAKEIMNKLDELSVENTSTSDQADDEQIAQKLADEILSLPVDNSHNKQAKSQPADRKRSPKSAKKQKIEARTIESATQIIATDSIDMDNDEGWGSNLD